MNGAIRIISENEHRSVSWVMRQLFREALNARGFAAPDTADDEPEPAKAAMA